MIAWYHSTEGLSANLCQLLYSERTRLIVIKDGKHLEYTVYPSWGDAVTALKNRGTGWTSDLTGKPLQYPPFLGGFLLFAF